MLSMLKEREKSEGTKDRGHGVNVRARRSARSNSDEGQKAVVGW